MIYHVPGPYHPHFSKRSTCGFPGGGVLLGADNLSFLLWWSPHSPLYLSWTKGYTILWEGRALMPRGIDSKKGVQLVYRRFSAFHRFNHYLVMVSFFGLALTGMPLKFQDSFWSQLFINAVGGVEMAGLIHRVMAVANITYFLLESGYMVYYVLARKGPIFGEDSIVPSWKDWRDMRGMFRWFFGKGPKPRFNRFTYWEKFDYWALFAGTILIGGSGLMMWFPEEATSILPGVTLNVALVIHSNEAFLATGVIFIFVHFFSAHGRPESFPAEGRRRLFSVVTGAATIFAFTAATYTLLLILWPLLF